MDRRLGYVPALDGMRGIAVLCVMLTHALGGGQYFMGGSIGVDMFFVLSGFLITYLLVREYDARLGRLDLRRFYLRRALRLGPALLLLLLTLLIAAWTVFDLPTAKSTTTDILITLGYATNWARAFDLHPPHLLGHTWSLSIEEQFYVLWPLLLLLLLRKMPSRMHVVFASLAGAGVSWAWRAALQAAGAGPARLYNGLDTRADALLAGCALGAALASGVIEPSWRPKLARALRPIEPIAIVYFAAVLTLTDWTTPWLYSWGIATTDTIVALLILRIFVAERSALRRLLSCRPLVWVGAMSYGLYLWHYPVYALLNEHGYGYRAALAGTALSFLIARASYVIIERPLLRLKRSPLVASLDPGRG